MWQERIAQWQASGTSMRAYAMERGFPVRQVGYWVRQWTKLRVMPALLPVRVAPAAASGAMSLRSERGWTLTLPGDVPAIWLAELMREL